ncbi:hypothetical protein NI470_05455 [Acinetobacter lwoffii]|uniref:hypothetical protein n=1 Tax=Acinetobacter lwoffii TaxID=28090 RepID=UPI00209B172B|nr:hypothetical protein [Acinetobacter lwoffii]MCO8073128.1 hypothetical protein [Acinetobacter lwoffii]MCO8076057.1 hypothetical protein [Acinetobacter lwoffii]
MMDIKEVVKTAILRNSHEWGDEQAEAVLKAINEAGFLVVPAKAQAVPDSPTEKTWDEIHLDPKERLYWSLRSAKKRKSDLNWSHASHQTCVGSTHGRKICEYLGVDPDGKDFVRTQEPAND